MAQGRLRPREKGAASWVLAMPVRDTRRGKALMGTFLSDIVLQVRSFVAEHEREAIRCRQAEGIAAARLQGKHLGRPPVDLPENFSQVRAQWLERQITLDQAAAECRMSRSSFHRYAAGAS